MNAKASIAFLKEAAAYFSKQPTDGEDSKHWANVLNSENCTHAAEVIASQASRIAEMEKALAFYRDGFHPTPHKRLPGLEWKPSEALLDDCGNIARSALNGEQG